MSRIKVFMALTVLTLAALALPALPAQAQAIPGLETVIMSAPDGRFVKYQMQCYGDKYAYMHVILYTAKNTVISFTQSCRSQVGTTSVSPNVYPTLTNAMGAVTRIQVIGYHRFSTTGKYLWPFVRTIEGDMWSETMDAPNDPAQTNDMLEPLSKTLFYLYAPPPQP